MNDSNGVILTIGDKVTFVVVHHRMNEDLQANKGKSGYIISMNQIKEKVLVDFDDFTEEDSFSQWWINPKNLAVEQFSSKTLNK